MNKLVDKQVRINLYPFKRSFFMIEAFSMAAREQGWSETETTLVANQIKGLSLDDRFEILLGYCHTFGEDASIVQDDVQFMLHHLGCHMHYLNQKPIKTWDEYDWSNYASLKRKATKRIRRVFALFSNTVQEKDKYVVESPPSVFYDTKQEAEKAIKKGQESITKIYALWIEE